MKALEIAQRTFFSVHVASLIFGLAGLLIVLPNTAFIAALPEFGQQAFQWSMAGGGAVYMISGALAVSIYAYRNLSLWHWLTFMLPALVVSTGAELLGTSTGFPFGEYHYLSGLGYKMAGLVPFTIPLSWFYLGFSAYLLAYMGLVGLGKLRVPSAIAFGSLLLTSWDFVLDPAMSQTTMPFWAWDQPGEFFGMPYQNFAGWFGTGAVFMAIAAVLWKAKSLEISNVPLGLPLSIYLSNFTFAMVISIDSKIYFPILLGLLLGVLPALLLYRSATETYGESVANFETLAVSGSGET
ncbi:gamma-carotene 1'-hydroxylase CruF [cf. Phormidesmis sp. LEGE 11477]|uniref:gamma-carotene 1'-hydroxylase CruF n=1 Tax=cf. Phormidesmis sp. LEGE 11477 TaxID=1828680 RepID=UPI00187F9062|nr:carotenoid biosynthesis protein [cf. Phormidesmis sp. LEGE 11477]MBE9062082.1 carotenoid biosynthesis protein [cf. Phormidesmis sp. LEGE 11477]